MNKLLELRKKNGYTQTFIANKLKIAANTYSQYETGKRQIPDEIKLLLADLYNVSIDYLIGRATDDDLLSIPNIRPVPTSGIVKMPIIGSISAGYDGIAQEEYLGEVEILEMALHGKDPNECFVLRIKGNSMYPDYRAGDLVLIQKQSSVNSGDVAVVLYNGDEATLKQVQYKEGEDWVRLIPRNPEYQEKLIKGADLEHCRILGRAISLVYRDVR